MGSTAIPLPPQQGQQQTASSGLDVLNNLLGQKQKIDADIATLSKAAASPIPGQGPGTSPGLALTPVPGFQPQSLSQKQVVGAKNVRNRDIGNLITSVSNVVGQYENKKKTEDTRVLAVDLERVMQAQAGIQQAQEVLAQDPNNREATALKTKNTGIIEAMLSDPKRRKQISKALDISFVDPTQNNKPEHQALQQAAKSYTQQLQEKTPAGLQPNQQAQQQLQIKQAQAKSIDEMVSKIAPTLIREQGSADRQQAGIQSKQQLEAGKEQSAWDRAKLGAESAYKRAIDVAQKNANSRMAVESAKEKAAWDRTQSVIKSRFDYLEKSGKGGPDVANLNKAKIVNDSNSLLTKQNTEIQQSLKRLDTLKANKMVTEEEYATKKSMYESQIQSNGAKLQENNDYLKDLSKEAQNGNSSESSSSNGLASKFKAELIGPEEDTADEDGSEDPDYYGTGTH
jgi:hypothetical protein